MTTAVSSTEFGIGHNYRAYHHLYLALNVKYNKQKNQNNKTIEYSKKNINNTAKKSMNLKMTTTICHNTYLAILHYLKLITSHTPSTYR